MKIWTSLRRVKACRFFFLTCVGIGLMVITTHAASVERFKEPKAWQCTFKASMDQQVERKTGPGGMASNSQRQFFQALGASGTKVQNPGGDTDSYRQSIKQTVEGKARLDYIYDGGPDGFQIAGWGNGGAQVHVESSYEGTEQNQLITRDKTASYDGFAKFEGEEVEPAFQIWLYPEGEAYALEYRLSAVKARQVEHCRMKEEIEADRKKLESATDKDMPLGSFFGGMTKFTCATEKVTEVDLDGGAFGALLEDIPLPSSGMNLSGEGKSSYIDSGEVQVQWDCRPE